MAAKKPASKPKRMPIGRAGGYAAPVDTVGMDEEMKKTLIPGYGKKKKPKR
jgi:hypothetical protein